jgi:hypothetical protein
MRGIGNIARSIRSIRSFVVQDLRDSWACYKTIFTQARDAYEQAKAEVLARQRTKSEQ